MTDPEKTFEQERAELLQRKIDAEEAETARLQRYGRLVLAAQERGVSEDLLQLVDHDDDEGATLARLGKLQEILARDVSAEVDRRFKSLGREPHGSDYDRRPLNLNNLTPEQINKDWRRISEKMQQAARRRK